MMQVLDFAVKIILINLNKILLHVFLSPKYRNLTQCSKLNIKLYHRILDDKYLKALLTKYKTFISFDWF